MINTEKPEFYIEDDFQEIKLHATADGKYYVKHKDGEEKEISGDTNIVAQAILNGSEIPASKY